VNVLRKPTFSFVSNLNIKTCKKFEDWLTVSGLLQSFRCFCLCSWESYHHHHLLERVAREFCTENLTFQGDDPPSSQSDSLLHFKGMFFIFGDLTGVEEALHWQKLHVWRSLSRTFNLKCEPMPQRQNLWNDSCFFFIWVYVFRTCGSNFNFFFNP